MYYIPTQDVMGTLSDVFTKFDEKSGQATFSKLTSTFSVQLEQNDFRSKLDKYLERAKMKNNVSISEKLMQSQTTQGSSSRIMIHDSEQQTTEITKPCAIHTETQCHIECEDKGCQIEEINSTENYESSKFQNLSSKVQGDSYQSQQSSQLLENIYVTGDRVEEECQKCGRSLRKVTDAECQYDKQTYNNSLSEFPLLRTRSRCMSQTNQFSQQKLSEAEEQFTLEEELQLRDQLLDQKFSEIQELQQQIEDLHKLLNDKQEGNDIDSNPSSENSIVEALNKQIQVHTEIQEHLTEQMMRQSEEVIAIKKELDELLTKNSDLIIEREQMIGVIGQLRDQLNEIEDSKQKEIHIINQDYRDKMSKQSMIIDELQQQLSIGSSPIYQQFPPTNKQLGSDSQLSRGSIRTKEEKDSMLKSLKKMTTITAGLMSTKYDYTTLGALGSLNQVKSQQKLESFKKQEDY